MLVFLFFVLVLFLAGPGSAAPSTRFVPGQILVKTRSSDYDPEKPLRASGRGTNRRNTVHSLKVHVLQVQESEADDVIRQLQADPNVEYVERNGIARVTAWPNDALVVSGQAWHLGRVHAPGAWNATTGNPAVRVAVLDSGLLPHADLPPVLTGYNFVNGGTDVTDDFGHGTAVAGVISARGNNGTGSAGVAYGCTLLPVKVVDRMGFASYDAMAQGILFAVEQGARVINISVAGDTPSAVLQDAIDFAWNKNVLVVAAAGNTGEGSLQYPAACNHVLSVSATGFDDTRATFSTYGSWVKLCAPGVDIWTTQRDPVNPYGTWRGTSFSSPIVAGVAALLISADQNLTVTDVSDILIQTSEDLGEPGPDGQFGAGLVNGFRSLASVLPALVDASGQVNTDPTFPPQADVDTERPALRLLEAPVDGARTFSPVLTLAGTARDDSGVDRVEIALNGGVPLPSVGTASWSVQVPLVPGTNYISVHAVDLSGNVSREIRRRIFYSVSSPVSIAVNGLGKVVPDLNGQVLELGRCYTVHAVPGPGQAFLGWNGARDSRAVLHFVMEPGLQLTADFVVNPFPAIKGTYDGLVTNPGTILPENSGYFSTTLSANGQFSGKVVIAGKRYPFSGRFDLDGSATVAIRSAQSMALRLSLDFSAGGALSGSMLTGGWASTVTASKNNFDSIKNPAQQAGTRSFVLHQESTGWSDAGRGTSRIYRSGTAVVRGALSNNSPFATAGRLGAAGQFPFYVSRQHGTEVVIGWLSFPAGSLDQTSGSVYWVRAGTNAAATMLQAASAQP